MPKNSNKVGRGASASGFTLIEVLVALAIAGMGLAALLVAVNQGLAGVGSADQYIEATRRAQSPAQSPMDCRPSRMEFRHPGPFFCL